MLAITLFDLVGKSLAQACQQLEQNNLSYTISYTYPNKKKSTENSKLAYIVRHTVDSAGVYHLVAAFKMFADNQ